jgi:uncharacterized membrane protein
MSAAPATPSDTGLDSNLAGALAYLLGLISGLVLLAIEKKDQYVRFHAMQSTLTFLGVLVLNVLLLGIPVIGAVLYVPFVLAVVALWIWLMLEAVRGHRFKLPYIGALAEQQISNATRPR